MVHRSKNRSISLYRSSSSRSTVLVATTLANIDPGIAYTATTWQFAVEAVLPSTLRRDTAWAWSQLLLFLDDLAPSVFGKPLLSR